MTSYVTKLNQPTYSSLNENLYDSLNEGLYDSIISNLNNNYITFGAEQEDSKDSSNNKKAKSETVSKNEASSKSRITKALSGESKEAASYVISSEAASSVSGLVSSVLGDAAGKELGSFAGDLTSMGLDRGAAFLTGAATTALAASPAGMAMGAVGNTVEQLDGVTKLFDICKNKLIDDITGIATSYITKLTTLPATATLELTSKSTYYLSYYTVMPADLLKDLIEVGKFSLNADQLKENVKSAAMSKMNEGIGKALGSINDKVSEKCEKVNSFIVMLSSYSTEGIEWVMNQMNSYTAFITNEVGTYVGKGYQIVEDNVMLAVDKVGEVVGKGAAEVINAATKLALKDKLDKVEAKKIYAKKYADSKVKQAILKLKGLMGG